MAFHQPAAHQVSPEHLFGATEAGFRQSSEIEGHGQGSHEIRSHKMREVDQTKMHNRTSKALTILLLAIAAATPATAQDKTITHSCEAFARMSGRSLPRTLPCVDYTDNQKYYKSFTLYCEARSLQSNILALQGCSEKHFKKQREIYKQQ